ncbi:MAG: DNA polymerase III subunit gamma/tau [Saprospirales bacterium]|nr:DNA polymerase III subunit gamma/tau [Saprospirales bacterium]
MTNFVVSARKYRPTRFDDVVGQGHVSQTLKNALQSDHLAHAFLFCGPRGVGKTTCARILAKVLNCQNVTADFEPCNVCDNCKSFHENASFNIIELDAASNNSVEHIRTLIEQVRFQPQQGKYKVFIIDEVHMLSQSAFNAFLKTLEEPPPYAIFILATTEKHKIIPTILSRCQIYDFKRIQVPDMVKHLQGICKTEGIKAAPEALHIIAQKADGALRDALSIFDRIVSFSGKELIYEDVIANLNVLDYDYYFRAVDALLTEDLPTIMLLFDDVLRKGFDGDLFINGLAEHLRNLLMCQDPATLPLLELVETLQARYAKQAQQSPPSFLLTALQIANDCDVEFKSARNRRLHVEMALIKMTYIQRAVSLASGIPMQPSETPEKKKADVSAPVSAPTPPVPPASEEKKVPEPERETSEPPKEEPKKSSSFDTPRLTTNLHALKGKVSLPAQADRGDVELELEEVQAAWGQYMDTVQSESIRSVIKTTDLALEDGKLIATVGSSFAENALREEKGMMEYLRKTFEFPSIDEKTESESAAAPKKNR